jgi:hypothetical protein
VAFLPNRPALLVTGAIQLTADFTGDGEAGEGWIVCENLGDLFLAQYQLPESVGNAGVARTEPVREISSRWRWPSASAGDAGVVGCGGRTGRRVPERRAGSDRGEQRIVYRRDPARAGRASGPLPRVRGGQHQVLREVDPASLNASGSARRIQASLRPVASF